MSAGGPPRQPVRRFYVASGSLQGSAIAFAPREAHHIARVLRLRAGTRIVAFDGTQEVDAELVEVSGHAVTARALGPARRVERPVAITLLQGLPRGPKMDLIVRMATEIGVAAVQPVLTTRSLPTAGAARLERWRRIAREAARQCGRGDVPTIDAPAPLVEALAVLGPVDLLVVPWERATRPLGAATAGRPFVTAGVVVGPEGGLTDDEVAAVTAAGGVAVSLGPLVLRTETAGVVTVAMLLYERLLRLHFDS
ncbi:MAG: RsmE family RNA methyltransferase [Armatimonadota bacterium]|nr:RsmE family RNA methyltransferase [Armatimonadota bacterium]MDR7536552.1 RsmE family RNA methyltransferase [Armatimonadota bacterium]